MPAPGVARLDVIRHPYGPCPAALDSFGQADGSSTAELSSALRQRLAVLHRVPPGVIRLFPDVESGVCQVVDGLDGSMVAFPPSRSASLITRGWPNRPAVYVARGVGRNGAVDPDVAADLPGNGIAIVESPSDPLGAPLSPMDLVRIARSCRWVVVDERFAEFAGRSLLPVAIEFDNVAVFRSFEVWAGLERWPIAWAVGSPAMFRSVPVDRRDVPREAVAAAMATLGELASLEATLRLIRDDRSRLYRHLRKLAFLEPLPSWGPFVTARVALGTRAAIVEGLAARGVRVHAPDEDGLEGFIRFGIGTRAEMNQLHRALSELGPTVVA